MKRCPVCSEILSRRRVELVEIDGCPGCGGLWLDKGELQQLAQDSHLLAHAGACFRPGMAAAVGGAATGQCPVCVQPLAPFEFERFRGVRLDRCKGCGGIWLDHGEAQAIAAQLPAPPPEPEACGGPPSPLAVRFGAAAPPAPVQPSTPAAPAPAAALPPMAAAPPPTAAAGPGPRRAPLEPARIAVIVAAVALVAAGISLVLRPGGVDLEDSVAELQVRLASGPQALGGFRGSMIFLRFRDPLGIGDDAGAEQAERVLVEKYREDGIRFLSVTLAEGEPAPTSDGWEAAGLADDDLYELLFEASGPGRVLPAYALVDRQGELFFASRGPKELDYLQRVLDVALAARR